MWIQHKMPHIGTYLYTVLNSSSQPDRRRLVMTSIKLTKWRYIHLPWHGWCVCWFPGGRRIVAFQWRLHQRTATADCVWRRRTCYCDAIVCRRSAVTQTQRLYSDIRRRRRSEYEELVRGNYNLKFRYVTTEEQRREATSCSSNGITVTCVKHQVDISSDLTVTWRLQFNASSTLDCIITKCYPYRCNKMTLRILIY